jgi:hypothetical protein
MSRSGITPRDLAACSRFAPYFKSNEVWALFLILNSDVRSIDCGIPGTAACSDSVFMLAGN